MRKTNQTKKRDAEKQITIQLTPQQVANAISDYVRGPLGFQATRCQVSIAAVATDRFRHDVEVQYHGFNCYLTFEEARDNG